MKGLDAGFSVPSFPLYQVYIGIKWSLRWQIPSPIVNGPIALSYDMYKWVQLMRLVLVPWTGQQWQLDKPQNDTLNNAHTSLLRSYGAVTHPMYIVWVPFNGSSAGDRLSRPLGFSVADATRRKKFLLLSPAECRVIYRPRGCVKSERKSLWIRQRQTPQSCTPMAKGGDPLFLVYFYVFFLFVLTRWYSMVENHLSRNFIGSPDLPLTSQTRQH